MNAGLLRCLDYFSLSGIHTTHLKIAPDAGRIKERFLQHDTNLRADIFTGETCKFNIVQRD